MHERSLSVKKIRAISSLDTPEVVMLRLIHIVTTRGVPMKEEKTQRNPADFAILGVLWQSPSHGYDLCRDLGERLGEIWTLRRSHIYALLAGLEKDGLVSHERVGQETRPTKKVFRITEEGARVFTEWLRSPVEPVRDMRLEFLAKLHFASLESPALMADLVADQMGQCLKKEKWLREKKRLCKSATERAAVDFRLAMVEATVAWLTRLRGPSGPRGDESPGRFAGDYSH